MNCKNFLQTSEKSGQIKAHIKLHTNERNWELIKVPKQITAGGHYTSFDRNFTQTAVA